MVVCGESFQCGEVNDVNLNQLTAFVHGEKSKGWIRNALSQPMEVHFMEDSGMARLDSLDMDSSLTSQKT